MTRDFKEWFSKFCSSISDYAYYVDFEKVFKNTEKIKIELNILNSLIGSKNIEQDFEKIITEYPQTLKCIPILLAVRSFEIFAMDADGSFFYNFKKMNYSIEQYKIFMRKTGLFDLLANHLINNLVDYIYGVETGLSSNGRKNRGGHIMENLVESYLKKTSIVYYKEMYLKDIEKKWGLDLSALSNKGKSKKRFDFVLKTDSTVYAIETNFYARGGSKLNETARSYKMLALESTKIKGFTFVWFTDGIGWTKAHRNLEETFDVMEHIYSINDIENGIMNKLFK
ncbi:MAG: type II restriction endonuclease [Endomicrobiaceae bacterium]|nr:type II restriction endonuclease [Endomicrobiaceae bacterium]